MIPARETRAGAFFILSALTTTAIKSQSPFLIFSIEVIYRLKDCHARPNPTSFHISLIKGKDPGSSPGWHRRVIM